MHLTTVSAGELLAPAPAPTPRGGSPVDLRGVVVVGVDGDVDIATAPELLRTLKDVLSAPTLIPGGEGGAAPRSAAPVEVAAVVVDLTEVEFIDSAAIGVLVQGHHLARRSGRAYALVADHPLIHSLFEITGLAQVLPLHPDIAAVVASLTPAA